MLSFGSRWTPVRHLRRSSYASLRLSSPKTHLLPSGPLLSRNINALSLDNRKGSDSDSSERGPERPEHAVISTFDLFSIGGECTALYIRTFLTPQ
jgi:hypothetical protein